MKITYITPSIKQILGYSVEEMLDIHFKNVLTKFSSEKVMNSISNLIILYESGNNKSDIPVQFELEFISKNGSTCWLDTSFTFLRNSESNQVRILGVGHDITARKQVEQEKAKIHHQLVQAQKMKAVGVLAGGIAHDFNNLLTVIQGNADMAMLKLNSESFLYEDLQEIQIATERAAELTNQLLMFSRKQPMKFSTFSINKIVEDMLRILHRLIGEDVAISTFFGHDLWKIYGDKSTLEQIIMNLAVNARDAMPEGGVIKIMTRNIEFNKEQSNLSPESREGKFIHLTVQDNGTGMDDNTLQHLFEPFFTTKSAGKGTGLGLSVVYGIVKQHKGWIKAESKKGEGSTFHIYIPACFRKEDKSEIENVSIDDLHGNGEKIMIVEDERGVREFTKTALHEYGYKVYSVSTCEEALKFFKKKKYNFDLVLTDVVLEDRSGLNLADELLSKNSKLNILLCSGYTGKKARWSDIQEKGYNFIQKPYTLKKLLNAVKKTIITEKIIFEN